MGAFIQSIGTPAAAGSASFPKMDSASSDAGGIEIILIIVAALLTLALLAFFIYVFTRPSE